MRSPTLLAAALLLTPVLAHADGITMTYQYFNYSGTLNADAYVLTIEQTGPNIEQDYDGPIAAYATITKTTYNYNGIPFGSNYTADLTADYPNFEPDYDLPTDFIHNTGNGYEYVSYFDLNSENYGPDPYPMIYAEGRYYYYLGDNPDGSYSSGGATYEGNLYLVADTPEPCTFALLGTGLLGVITLGRRKSFSCVSR